VTLEGNQIGGDISAIIGEIAISSREGKAGSFCKTLR